MSRIIIRRMRESDLTEVSELAVLANPFVAKEKYYQHLLDELRKNPDLSLVAIRNGKVVGYVQADIQNGVASLEDIAVSKEYQRKGIGKCLMDHELDALRRRGVKTVLAEVHYKCASAIPFYYKHNFRITRCRRDFYGKGHDAIVLKLLLSEDGNFLDHRDRIIC